jgi:hypothetical protein
MSSKVSKSDDGVFGGLIRGLALLAILGVVTLGMRLGWSLYFISLLVVIIYGFITGSDAVKKYTSIWRMMVGFSIFLMFIIVLGGIQGGVGIHIMVQRALLVMIGVFGISRVILSVLATFEEI